MLFRFRTLFRFGTMPLEFAMRRPFAARVVMRHPVVVRHLLLVAALALPAGAQAESRRAQLPPGYEEVDGIAAVVGDQIITVGDLRRALGTQQSGQQVLPGEAEKPRSEAALRMQTLQALIDNALVLKAAKDLGLTVEDREVEAQLEQTRKRNGWTEDEMVEAVRRIGFPTLVAYRAHVRSEMLRVQMLKIKLGSRLRVTDEEVKKTMELEHCGGTCEDEVRARHILVALRPDASPREVAALREKAWKLHDQVKAQPDKFAEIAEKFSDDRGAPEGDLGYQRRWVLDQTFANKLWSMKKGEISPVVQTTFGFHVIQMLDRRRVEAKDAEMLQNFVRARLSEEQFLRLYRQWMDELRKSSHIEVRIAR